MNEDEGFHLEKKRLDQQIKKSYHAHRYARGVRDFSILDQASFFCDQFPSASIPTGVPDPSKDATPLASMIGF